MQQLFRLLIFLIQHYMFRATNSPILTSTFWLYRAYTVKKCSSVWTNFSPETCRAELKRLIYERVVASCWYLHRCTIMMNGHTNIKFGNLTWLWQKGIKRTAARAITEDVYDTVIWYFGKWIRNNWKFRNVLLEMDREHLHRLCEKW